MKISRGHLLIVCILVKLLGIIIFLKGFFPLKSAVPGYASWNNYNLEPIQTDGSSGSVNTTGLGSDLSPTYQRMMFVLIDALRADFVLPSTKTDLPKMNFVSELISKSETKSFLAKAHPPTVTMPRIKALTTGSIPGFVDVVLNFDSKALKDDNLISQLHRAGKNILFYGDDTWMKLFPGHFIRTDGTTSFFVTDYTEVDHNVTRHLDTELKSQDWDVLILHYLGLDHIGHLAGPRSSLVAPKLEEMDGIIRRLYNSIVAKEREGGPTTLLVVCGDHGMSDQGSHGGSTPTEVNTPVIILSSHYQNAKGSKYEDSRIEQIDLVPTLSFLLGIPIPQNNLGLLISDVLSDLDIRSQLQATYINAQQIMGVFMSNVPSYQNEPAYVQLHRAVNSHRAWLDIALSGNSSVDMFQFGKKIESQYRVAMETMRAKVTSSLSSYDVYAMAVGILIVWMVLISLIWVQMTSDDRLELPPVDSLIPVVITCGIALLSLHVILCTSCARDTFLCQNDVISLLIGSILISFASVWMGIIPAKICVRAKMKRKPLTYSILGICLWTGTALHTLSLLSSSFVEEEHQTWYFFSMTICLLVGVLSITQCSISKHTKCVNLEKYSTLKKTRSDSNYIDGNDAVVYSELQDNRMDNNMDNTSPETCNELSTSVPASKEATQITKNQYAIQDVMILSFLLALCRLSRAWNQTGDKWAHLPDIGDWLVRPENKWVISTLAAVSLSCICILTTHRQRFLNKLLFFVAAFFVYCFRAANGTLTVPFTYQDTSKGILEARVVFTVILLWILTAAWSSYVNLKQTIMVATKQKSPLPGEQDKKCNTPNNIPCQTNNLLQKTYTHHVTYTNLQSAWIMLMMLLLRPHNLPLVAMVTLQEACLGHVIKRIKGLDISTITLLYVWMGQAAFFYQGNSNSIASVDVSAGYIGLQEYNPLVIGLLMCLNTYCGPIFWLTSLMKHLANRDFLRYTGLNKRYLEVVVDVCYTLALTRVIPVAVYIILVTAQRYHLFVWTVFSPKLLYEAMHTLLISVFIGLLLLSRSISRT